MCDREEEGGLSRDIYSDKGHKMEKEIVITSVLGNKIRLPL